MGSGLRFVKRAVQADLARFKAYVEMKDVKGLDYSPEKGNDGDDDDKDKKDDRATRNRAAQASNGDSESSNGRRHPRAQPTARRSASSAPKAEAAPGLTAGAASPLLLSRPTCRVSNPAMKRGITTSRTSSGERWATKVPAFAAASSMTGSRLSFATSQPEATADVTSEVLLPPAALALALAGRAALLARLVFVVARLTSPMTGC